MANDRGEFDYTPHDGQRIDEIDIKKEISSSFIEYAMSVIISRALPDVRDGLKPVHRRVLYAMYEDKLFYNAPFRKSATTVGYVIGHYHPHGDMAVYDTLVRMAQTFSLRYPLVDGHGNFGNIDGDGAAAYRYTAARMARITNLMLSDIEKDTVDFVPNFDNKQKEPSCLPSRFPNLLVNGSIGIAVGMATNIPPHNLGEVIDAAIFCLENPDATVRELMSIVKGPDFPTAGIIYGSAGIYEAYATGKGRIKVRAKADIEEKRGRTAIIITELPYQVNRSTLLANMAQLVKDKRVEGVSDIRNESGRNGMRIVVELKRDANAQVVLNLFYKYTQLQDTCAVNMIALVGGEPKTLTLREILIHYLAHQREVITRRTCFELNKAEKEAHIYEGYKIAIDFLDEVIKIIRASDSVQDAKERLMVRFGLDEVQAQAIVDMTLGRLSGLERKKIEDRLLELYEKIKELKGIIDDKDKVDEIIKTDLTEIKEKFGDARKTKIEESGEDILIEDLIDREDCVITVTGAGYIKRLPVETYTVQRRGGKGITAMSTKEEDYVKDVYISHSHDSLLMFSNMGKMYTKRCFEVPEASRVAKGSNIANLLSLDEGETITAAIPINEFSQGEYLVMLTRRGVIKRVELAEYNRKRATGLYAITLDEGDELLFVMKTDGSNHIFAATSKGLSITFDENGVRPMGRYARGIRAIRLGGDDFVVGAIAIPADTEEKTILTITESGYGKKAEISDFTPQNRGGKGILCHRVSDKTGLLVGASLVGEEDDVMLITDAGTIIRTSVGEIPVYGRNTSGVILMRTRGDAVITGFAVVSPESEKDEETPDDIILDEENLENSENNESVPGEAQDIDEE
ncbi:MAG: DNA gyrase subunit A [Eubacteriales bacterium]